MEQVHFHKMIPKYFWQKFTMFLFQRVMIGIVQCNAMFFLFSLEQSCAPWISIVFSTSFDFFQKMCNYISDPRTARMNIQLYGLLELFDCYFSKFAYTLIPLIFFKIITVSSKSKWFFFEILGFLLTWSNTLAVLGINVMIMFLS